MSIGTRVGGALGENLALKILSLVLALAAWMLGQGEQTHQATVVIPVEYAYPSDLILLSDGPPPELLIMQASASRAALKKLEKQVREGSIRYDVDLQAAAPVHADVRHRLQTLAQIA